MDIKVSLRSVFLAFEHLNTFFTLQPQTYYCFPHKVQHTWELIRILSVRKIESKIIKVACFQIFAKCMMFLCLPVLPLLTGGPFSEIWS